MNRTEKNMVGEKRKKGRRERWKDDIGGKFKRYLIY